MIILVGPEGEVERLDLPLPPPPPPPGSVVVTFGGQTLEYLGTDSNGGATYGFTYNSTASTGSYIIVGVDYASSSGV